MNNDAAQHSERAHAWAAPSAASRWGGWLDEPGCPGSIALSQLMEGAKESSPEALDGTQAHELLETCLRNRLFDCRQYILAPLYTNEQLSSVNVALDLIGRIVSAIPQVEIHCEITAYISPDFWGHVDIVLFDPVSCQLWIIDFKHGKYGVHAKGNPQLLSYVLGVLPMFPKAHQINVAIIQPRRADGLHPLQKWEVDRASIERWALQSYQAIMESRATTPVYRPSASRCRYCAGAFKCPAVMAAPKNAPDLGLGKSPRKKPGEDKLPPPLLKNGQPVTLAEISHSDLRQVAEALIGLDVVKAYVKNLEALKQELGVIHKLPIPGWKLVAKKERIEWNAEESEIAKRLWQLGRVSPNEVLPQKLISITAAKELLAEAIKGLADKTREEIWMAFAELTTRIPSDGVELVPETDERPAYSETMGNRAGFNQVVFIDTPRNLGLRLA